MTIVAGFDVHRAQITVDQLDTESGEVSRCRIAPADRVHVRRFLKRLGDVDLVVALEATTGWRFVVEELRSVDAEVHLAEPAEASTLRGTKRRAKTDRTDARHLRELVMQGRVPESWIPPHDILELRSRVRLRKTLVDERTSWLQRIHATLFHHGVIPSVKRLNGLQARGELGKLDLPPAAIAQIEVALSMIDHLNAQIHPIELELERTARARPGCRALMEHYGIGPRVATAILAELGDARRFSSSRQAVRFAGLDITVHESDGKRRGGRLSRQGPPVLRWAVFEAAQTAARPASPDHSYYLELKQRLGANRAALAIARKYIRRSHHALRELGEEALATN